MSEFMTHIAAIFLGQDLKQCQWQTLLLACSGIDNYDSNDEHSSIMMVYSYNTNELIVNNSMTSWVAE